MDSSTNFLATGLRQILQHRGTSRLISLAVQYLKAHLGDMNAELTAAVIAEILAFSESRNPDVIPDLARHGPEHTAETLAVHPNTIHARFQRILELTERDARSYHNLTELLNIADCRKVESSS